jgi:hypothetical protein
MKTNQKERTAKRLAIKRMRQTYRDIERQHERARERAYTAVHEVREYGLTWAEIGKALGMTKQAAAQRFGSEEYRPNGASRGE